MLGFGQDVTSGQPNIVSLRFVFTWFKFADESRYLKDQLWRTRNKKYSFQERGNSISAIKGLTEQVNINTTLIVDHRIGVWR